MIPVLVDPALLAMQTTAETVGTATIASAGAVAGPVVSTVVPAGSDSVSVRAAAVMAMRGTETTAIIAEFAAMRGLFAGVVASNELTYTAVETITATTASIA